MLEVLNYLQNANTIEGLNIDDLKNLLSSSNKTYKNFVIKMVTKDSIVVYNKNIAKNAMIKCVKNYYDLGDYNCIAIKDKINLDLNYGCKECHLKCLSKHANGEINKI